MEITLISKARYDKLVSDIKNLEAQILMANTQLKAIQDSNNSLAEIAFDENRFSEELLQRCEQAAEVAAREAIDIDDIASEVSDRVDIADDVHRVIERMDLQTGEEVNDRIEDVLNQYDYVDRNDVEEMIEEQVRDCVEDVINDRIEDVVHRLVGESLAGHTDHIIQLIVNKLTAKENHNATDNHQADHSLQVSGTNGHGEVGSHVQPNA